MSVINYYKRAKKSRYGLRYYLREYLRIFSGVYGLLRPFDGVTSYRLEMQAGLAEHKIEGPEDLRAFDQLGCCFRGELSAEDRSAFLKRPA